MRDIDVTSLAFSKGGYTATLTANDGEDELVIMFSPSQSGSGPIMIVALACDGGCFVKEQRDLMPLTGAPQKCNCHQPWVKLEHTRDAMASAIFNWTAPKLEKERNKALRKVKAIVEQLADHWELP